MWGPFLSYLPFSSIGTVVFYSRYLSFLPQGWWYVASYNNHSVFHSETSCFAKIKNADGLPRKKWKKYK